MLLFRCNYETMMMRGEEPEEYGWSGKKQIVKEEQDGNTLL